MPERFTTQKGNITRRESVTLGSRQAEPGPVLAQTVKRKPLNALDFHDMTREFIRAAGAYATVSNVTKFLCGVSAPAFAKLRVKAIPHFGDLERYPFLEVRRWVGDCLKPRR